MHAVHRNSRITYVNTGLANFLLFHRMGLGFGTTCNPYVGLLNSKSVVIKKRCSAEKDAVDQTTTMTHLDPWVYRFNGS